ncbi:hypothetical protein O6H91_19G012300 [Diphasiastrum complanatum]|uniref:Uncharacterized protein n=2 Tax=Diphasiastrum complanatum TaxID=34168 RepID=A0ACC2AST7_DIPCM|nr:hypothetical protein O6H91_19G012300 [Diphasiastrum complanatum]
MDRKQAEWIWEHVLKHSSSRRLLKYVVEAFPIPDDNIRLKKIVLLRTLSNEVSKGFITELCLELLHGLAELSKSEIIGGICEGNEADQSECRRQQALASEAGLLEEDETKTVRELGQEAMKENGRQTLKRKGDGAEVVPREAEGGCQRAAPSARVEGKCKDRKLQNPLNCKIRVLTRELELALKVELTVQHLRDKNWPAFLSALDKYWDDSVDEEKINDRDDVHNSAQKQMKMELWAIKARPQFQSEAVSKYKQNAVEKMLKAFLDLAWEEVGPTFLEKVEEDVLKGAYRPAGGVKLLQCTCNRSHQEDKINQGKCITGMRNVRQDSPEVLLQVDHGVDGKRNSETLRGDDTDQNEIGSFQDKMLHETSMIRDAENQAITKKKCNNKTKDQLDSKCSQGPPLKKLKGMVTSRSLEFIARKQSLEEGLAKGRMGSTTYDIRQEQHDVMLRLHHVHKNGGESKHGACDGEISQNLRHSRLIEEDETVQMEGLQQKIQDTGASDHMDHMNQRIEEANENSRQQYNVASTETERDQAKNTGPRSKSGPRLMRGSIEKRRIFRKGIIDERLITFGMENLQHQRSMSSANPEVSKAQQELKDSQSCLQSCVKDPLPAAIEIAEEVRDFIEKSVHLSPVTIERPANLPANNAVSFVEWEAGDEIEDDQAEISPSDSKCLRSPELKSKKVSPMKHLSSSMYQAHRRRHQKWSKLEEDTLRKGVARHGKGRWKLILQKHLDIFQDRTEVDLKDKWRNVERSEGLWSKTRLLS